MILLWSVDQSIIHFSYQWKLTDYFLNFYNESGSEQRPNPNKQTSLYMAFCRIHPRDGGWRISVSAERLAAEWWSPGRLQFGSRLTGNVRPLDIRLRRRLRQPGAPPVPTVDARVRAADCTLDAHVHNAARSRRLRVQRVRRSRATPSAAPSATRLPPRRPLQRRLGFDCLRFFFSHTPIRIMVIRTSIVHTYYCSFFEFSYKLR